MIEIRPLVELNPEDLSRIIVGYTSNARYRVSLDDNGDRSCIMMEYESLPQPFHKTWELTSDDLEHYQQVIEENMSLGAYVDGHLAAIALAEPHQWNRTMWVWEFNVLEKYRRQGVGLQLMNAVVEEAQTANLRTVLVEVQNTNAPAIRFYRKAGFRVEGIDTSYYTNEDLQPGGEVAVFMKRRIP